MPSRSILVVLATVMLNMTGVGLVWPILPSLVGEMSGGPVSHVAAVYGAVAVLYSLMQFLFAPMLGALSDRHGRRPVMLLALAGLGIDNLLLALAPSIAWVFVGRLLGGIFGATTSVANACMADVSEGKDRAAAFGMIGAAFGVGFILGPLIGGVLGAIDLRLPFYCAAGLSFANLLFGWLALEETLPPSRRGNAAARRAGPLAAFAWLWRRRALLPLTLSLFLANTIQRGLESIWVLFTAAQYGWGMRQAGLSLALVGVSSVVVQGFMVRHVVARFGERLAVGAGLSLSAAMYCLLAFNTSGALGYAAIVPHVIGWGLAGPALQALASRQADSQSQGRLQGALTGLLGLSAIAGPALAAATFSWSTSSAAPAHFPGAYFLFGAAVLVASALLGARARRPARAGFSTAGGTNRRPL